MTFGSTLARYIAARFLRTIGAVFMLCLVLIFMIDFLELLRSTGKEGTVPIGAVAWITLLRLPSFAELTLPFAVLAGSIGAFLTLNRSSELVVTRAGGMSVWQLLLPGAVVAAVLGATMNMAYSPLAAMARAEAERAFAAALGEDMNLLRSSNSSGQWLRQDSVDGSSVLQAKASADQGLSLTGVKVIQFDRAAHFVESVDARKAELRDGYWGLSDVIVSRAGSAPERYKSYQISTYLTPVEVRQSLGSEFSLSYWQLPAMIELAEKAGLPATNFKVQYATMRARPALYAIMVFLAATVSLRAFRSGGIQTKVITGVVGGFALFILGEVSRQLGVAGLISALVSAWVPTAVAGLVATTVLLHQEDG
jgi:lipopolysaccharide export system permease protein